jgi:hypothetical protein
MGCRLSVRSEGRVLPGNRATRGLRQSIGRATAAAAAAMGSSKKEARAMALEPQPRSHQPCRPGAETGEQSARARSRSLDFRGETRVAVRRQAAGDGAMGRGGLEQGKQHVIYTRSTDSDGCYGPGAGPRPSSPPLGEEINEFEPRLPRTQQRPSLQASAHGGGSTGAGCRTAQLLAILRLRCGAGTVDPAPPPDRYAHAVE